MSEKPDSRISEFIRSIKSSEYTQVVILAFIIGLLAGLGAIAFKYMIEGMQWLFYGQTGELFDVVMKTPWYKKLLIPAAGGAIVGTIIYKFAREAKGHGVPEVMSAVALRGGVIRRRVVGVKAVASAISIGSGASVGSEGPIIQIGAAIGSAIGQHLNLSAERMKSLVGCGAAAGIAAIFNAPIAGVQSIWRRPARMTADKHRRGPVKKQ